jgi:uracil phosphoribosyltransferase
MWEEVLKREGLSHTKVIGGGRIDDGYVVTGDVKGAVVDHLYTKGLHVVAFGYSPLDMEMFKKADQAIVVVGDKASRSKMMDDALNTAIEQGLQIRQVILSETAPPRLDIGKLPLTTLSDSRLLDSIFCHPTTSGKSVSFLHATAKNAAKVLMTQTRDATVTGPSLREAHRRVGWYLATEYLYDLVGVEEYEIPHVQGNKTIGYRLQHEKQTIIIPLMRGGEAMAFGVSEALSLASFLHAKNSEDVKALHLKQKTTVILVDSVVNSGKSVVEFVERIRKLSPTARIVIVSGVVQDQAVASGELADMLALAPNLHLVALRLSENKYTGKGRTDTGHRLFNTTDQD